MYAFIVFFFLLMYIYCALMGKSIISFCLGQDFGSSYSVYRFELLYSRVQFFLFNAMSMRTGINEKFVS